MINNNNNGPPWGLYCFCTVLLFTILRCTQIQIQKQMMLAIFLQSWPRLDPGTLEYSWFFLISLLLQIRLPFVELHCLGPVTFAQVFADPHALANPVGSHIWISQGQQSVRLCSLAGTRTRAPTIDPSQTSHSQKGGLSLSPRPDKGGAVRQACYLCVSTSLSLMRTLIRSSDEDLWNTVHVHPDCPSLSVATLQVLANEPGYANEPG